MIEIYRKRRKPQDERRNRQVTAVFREEPYEAAQKIAAVRGCSTNNVLNIALEEYVKQYGNEVKEYDSKLEEETILEPTDDSSESTPA